MQVDDKTGRVTGTHKTYAICGFIRGMVRLPHNKEQYESGTSSYYSRYISPFVVVLYMHALYIPVASFMCLVIHRERVMTALTG